MHQVIAFVDGRADGQRLAQAAALQLGLYCYGVAQCHALAVHGRFDGGHRLVKNRGACRCFRNYRPQ